MYEPRTTIDVGGIMHYARESTLRKSSVISHILDKWRASENADEHPFIDRDGLIFYHILNFLRSGTVVVSDDGSVTVDGANVVSADVDASNGVIHVIDAVIMPGE